MREKKCVHIIDSTETMKTVLPVAQMIVWLLNILHDPGERERGSNNPEIYVWHILCIYCYNI